MEKSLASQLRAALGRKRKNIIFACIGTDRSTGDCLGPLVGMQLERLGYNVIGTIDNPLHAENLEDRVNKIPKNLTIIAVDACLGRTTSVGRIVIDKGSLQPGAGVGKNLPAVGNVAIKGVVNAGGFMEYFVLQNTRLSRVMDMANQIVAAIIEVLPTPAILEVAATNKKESPKRATNKKKLNQIITQKARIANAKSSKVY